MSHTYLHMGMHMHTHTHTHTHRYVCIYIRQFVFKAKIGIYKQAYRYSFIYIKSLKRESNNIPRSHTQLFKKGLIALIKLPEYKICLFNPKLTLSKIYKKILKQIFITLAIFVVLSHMEKRADLLSVSPSNEYS